MSHMHYHAESSAKKFGGKPEDYYELHSWFDETKELFGDFRHRALRHHAQGIYELERKFGVTITNSDGRQVPVRLVGEQHVREDCGNRIPSVQDWLSQIIPHRWMNAGYDQYQRNAAAGAQEGVLSLYLIGYSQDPSQNLDQLVWAENKDKAIALWAKRWDVPENTIPDSVHLIPAHLLVPPTEAGVLEWGTDLPAV